MQSLRDATGVISYQVVQEVLIVSAAMQSGCSTLYSEDMQHDQLIDTVRIVDPFRPAGTSLH